MIGAGLAAMATISLLSMNFLPPLLRQYGDTVGQMVDEGSQNSADMLENTKNTMNPLFLILFMIGVFYMFSPVLRNKLNKATGGGDPRKP